MIRIFDDSIHLYVLNEYYDRDRVKFDIDTDEYNEIMDYQFMTEDSKLKCADPLYISYELSMISAIIKQSQTSFDYLTQTYQMSVWILLLTTILFLSLFTKILLNSKSDAKETFWSSFWIYFSILIGNCSLKQNLNIMQLLFVLSMFPFIEIIRNNLLSNLISVPERNANNINDLINGYYKPYLIDRDLKKALSEQINKQEIDYKFKEKIIKLNKIVTNFALTDSLGLLKDRNKLQQLANRLTILKSQMTMPNVKGFLIDYIELELDLKCIFQN